MEEILEKWCIFDPEGKGFISPEDLAFLLNELNPPIGFKNDKNRFTNL